MRRDLLAKEETIRYYGNDSNRINLYAVPVLYVKRVQIVVPGTTGISIPIEQLLIDYQDGEAVEYTPLLWMGAGLTTIFPHNVPIDITLAHGYGASILKAATWSSVDAHGQLTAGNYNVAVVGRTMWGEFPATPRVVTTAGGAIVLTVQPLLGAYVYRAYVSDASHNTTLTGNAAIGAGSLSVAGTAGMTVGSQWLVDSEIVTISAVGGSSVTLSQPTSAAHNTGAVFMPVPTANVEAPFTAFGTAQISMTISSLIPTDGLWPDTLPVTDTSAPVMPQELIEAVRLFALSSIYEGKNKSNQGYYIEESGKKRILWRSTEGTSGRGKPLMVQEAEDLLQPLSLQAIY